MACPMFAEAKAPLKVDVFQMPAEVELSAVTTAGHYILASHLVRPLTKVDKFGRIKGDLAKSWHFSDDRRVWKIQLVEAKFSNGEKIVASDVVSSIRRQISHATGVHFPFVEIKSIKELGQDAVEIELKSPRNDFIFELAKPEFGVLYKSDVAAEKGKAQFKVTSGPYYVSSKEGTTYSLKRNTNYTEDAKNNADLVFSSSSGAGSAVRLEREQIRFFTTQQSLSLIEHKSFLERNSKVVAHRPHIGFSYWLSINSQSPHFKDQAARARLQVLLHDYQSKEIDGFFWEKAHQLYLPDGDGRPTEGELKGVWQAIKSKAGSKQASRTKLRILPLKAENSITKDVIEFLSKHYDVQVLKYASEEELTKYIKEGDFEVKISSNDFSSVDLFENLKTTFNASRPYVFLGNFNEIPKLMAKASATDDRTTRSDYFKRIGISLLNDGLIAPLAYLRICFYADSGLDVSEWSTVFPEISFWKVKLND